MNASPISVNASVSDAAANTVTSPDTAGSVAALWPSSCQRSRRRRRPRTTRRGNPTRPPLRPEAEMSCACRAHISHEITMSTSSADQCTHVTNGPASRPPTRMGNTQRGRLIVQRDARRAVIRKARQSVQDSTRDHDRDRGHAPPPSTTSTWSAIPSTMSWYSPPLGGCHTRGQRRTLGQVGRGALADVGEQLTVDHLHDRRHDMRRVRCVDRDQRGTVTELRDATANVRELHLTAHVRTIDQPERAG